MQKEISSILSRSSFKYIYSTFDDVKTYYLALVFKRQTTKCLSRNTSFNLLNCNRSYKVHQGQFFSTFFINKFYTSIKLGAISKTRRPFFF